MLGISCLKKGSLLAFAATGLLAMDVFADVSGYVKLPSGDAVQGATVELVSSGKSARTDASGHFTIQDGTTALAQAFAQKSARLENGVFHFSTVRDASVQVFLHSILGKSVYNFDRQQMNAGEHELSFAPAGLQPGFYIVTVLAGSERDAYKIRYTGDGFGVVTSQRATLKKTTANDSLKVTYDNEIGKVAVNGDVVDDIIITRKVVLGAHPASVAKLDVSMKASSGESLTPVAKVLENSYEASSPWMFFRSGRTWQISANGVSVAGVSDDVLSVTIDIEEGLQTTAFDYSATLEYSTSDYSYVTIDFGAAQVAQALGISESQLGSVTYYAVNADGSLDSNSTANAPGHWFDANGNVTEYGNAAYIYSEVNLSTMTANVGQYPAKLNAGSTYNLKQAVRSGNKMVVFSVKVKVLSSGTPASSSSTPISSSSSIKSSASESSSSVATTITMADLEKSNPGLYKFVNWEWEYRLSRKGIVQGEDGTYDDYRTENSDDMSYGRILNGNGTLKYCVIWEKKSALSKTKRDQIRQMLNDIVNAWTDYLVGFEGWPYSKVNVVVSGWAVYESGYIQDKQSDETVYTQTKFDDMTTSYYTLNFGGTDQPYCPDGTYDEKFQIVDGYTEYSSDMWGFAGTGYWVAAGHVESSLGYGIPHIVAHESGHNFGLPDYYQSWDFPDANYSSPKASSASDGGIIAKSSYSGIAVSAIMNSGSSATITEYDYWLLRKFWYETKSRYGY